MQAWVRLCNRLNVGDDVNVVVVVTVGAARTTSTLRVILNGKEGVGNQLAIRVVDGPQAHTVIVAVRFAFAPVRLITCSFDEEGVVRRVIQHLGGVGVYVKGIVIAIAGWQQRLAEVTLVSKVKFATFLY